MFRILISCALLALSLPAFSQEQCTCPCACPAPEPPQLGLKSHFGHYMWLDRNNTDASIRAGHFKQIAALANEPSIKGVKLAIYWAHLEGAPGDYSAGFKILDEYLMHLERAGKYLMLSVQDRAFGNYGSDYTKYVPAYIVSGAGYGMTKMSNGITARVWQAKTTDRLIALSKALAARYDQVPNFEMYQTEETAVGVRINVDGYTYLNHATQIKRLMIESRKAWATSQVRLSANFFGSDSQMLDILKFCDEHDIAVGGPDIIPNQTIQANRVYEKYFLGKMVWVSEVQSPSLGGHEGTFTAKQIYDTGMKLKPSYFVWYRNTWSGGTPQRWDTGLLPYIRSVQGRVVTACPTNVVCAQ